jgi:hypothetical protein
VAAPTGGWVETEDVLHGRVTDPELLLSYSNAITRSTSQCSECERSHCVLLRGRQSGRFGLNRDGSDLVCTVDIRNFGNDDMAPSQLSKLSPGRSIGPRNLNGVGQIVVSLVANHLASICDKVTPRERIGEWEGR